MLRKSTLTVLSLLGVAGSLGFHGCGSESDGSGSSGQHQDEVGNIGLDLRLPDGSEVSEVSYSITRTGLTPRTGTLPVGSNGHASGQIGNLPAGDGYSIKLTAARGTLPPCEGSASFSISVGQTTPVSVALQCGALGRTGNVSVDGTFNYCPSLSTVSAAPNTAMLGQPIAVSVEAFDEDPVSFAWSAASGSFSTPAQASTTFTCSALGTVTLKVTVSDNQGCNNVVGTLDVTCTATFSSQPAYVIPVATGVTTKAILTVGDAAGSKADGKPYRFVGIPDGLGAFDNGDDTFTLLANHELGATQGIARAHGGSGAFVSRWKIRKSDLGVLGGSDLIQTVNLWNASSSAYAPGTSVAFGRFCSGDLPGAALYEPASGLGYDGRIYFNGEEVGNEGRALAHVLDGASYELPWLGKASWENIVVSPHAQTKTVAIGLDDTSPQGQVYVYVGTKTNVGLPVEKAGLNNGSLFGVTVPSTPIEPAAGTASGPFTLSPFGNVSSMTGAALDAASITANVTRFLRPEDGTWDPAHPNDFYFVTTNAIAQPSRLWRLRFQNIAQPELGGTIDMLLDGSEGQSMLDNLGMDARGHIMLTEDPGNNARIAQLWRYDVASDTLVNVAQHNPALFTSGAAGFITQDEEASGIVDATAILGPGWWLLSDQIHAQLTTDPELVERGQLTALYDPGSI